MILASLICLVFLYIFFMLNELDLAFAAVFTCIFSLGTLLYSKLNRDLDARIEFLHVFGALLLIAIILRLTLKKYSRPNNP